MYKETFISILIIFSVFVSSNTLVAKNPQEKQIEKNLNVSLWKSEQMRKNFTSKKSRTQNKYYLVNRAPLIKQTFVKLPVASVKAQGWLLECIIRQRNGLSGNLGEISQWLVKKDNAWTSKDGRGGNGWEEVPYWLKGYAHLGYLLEDKEILKESKFWIKAVLNTQRPDGSFGGVVFHKGGQSFWGQTIMIYVLQSYYEYSKDKRVIELMTKFYQYRNKFRPNKILPTYWASMRGGDNIHSVLWLYNHTGYKWLLDYADKLYNATADWEGRYNKQYRHARRYNRFQNQPIPDWYKALPNWHNVNMAQAFRTPATYYQRNGNKKTLAASYKMHDIIRKYFGQVPGGMFGSDEIARVGYSDPRQAIETCGVVEEMNSDEHMLRITGDAKWADQGEDVAFNTYPATMMPDMKSLRYLTSPNMVISDARNHHPDVENKGPFLIMNPFSSRCCQHNHTQGWPYYVENLWMATHDNGLVAAFYAANTVNAKVGSKGENVSIKQTTIYPFEETIRLKISIESKKEVKFPLYLRVPKWAKKATFSVNNKTNSVALSPNTYVRLTRSWKDDDEVSLNFPMSLSVRKWKKNNNSVSVNYGPLTFSLKIEEKLIKKESDKTAIGDSKWQKGADVKKWPSFEIHPNSPWNYGLVYKKRSNLTKYFKINKKAWPKDNYPFTLESTPIWIEAKGKIISTWKTGKTGMVGELPKSPVYSDKPTKKITLVPMGAARLRIASFPVVK